MPISLVPGLILDLVEADAVGPVVDEAVHRGPVVRQLDADDDVGIADQRRPAPGLVEIMGVRHVHAAALVDHRGLQQLGELDQQLDAVRRARGAVDDDDRTLRIGEQTRRLATWRPCRPAGGAVGTYFGM